jgi:hypothetical protein
MSPQRAFFTLAAIGFSLALTGQAAAAVSVNIDATVPVSLGAEASQVIVGNPSIADVSLTDRRHIQILGRSYGLTSVVALDAGGRRIFETTVNVAPAQTGRVSLFRGVELYNYACADRCERTPMPGESTAVYQAAVTPYSDYAGRAKTAAGDGGTP